MSKLGSSLTLLSVLPLARLFAVPRYNVTLSDNYLRTLARLMAAMMDA
jgi:hypothetical protein